MGITLDDGTVIPSYLSVEGRGDAPGSTEILNDFSFRLGEVKKVVYPDDPLSQTKKVVEYIVEVQYIDGDSGIPTTSDYQGVTTSSMFGSQADHFRASLRTDDKTENTQTSDNSGLGTGSKVLLLCISGHKQSAVIIAAITDPLRTKKDLKDDGHNLFFEFNGIRFTVDKDGQATMLFRGATKNNGELAQDAVKEAEGTNVLLDKNGSFKVATPKDAQYVQIDHKNKKIEILADEEWNVTVNGKTNLQVQKDITINSSAGEIDIGAANNVKIQSAGVKVGAATDAWMLGTTYRAAQAQLHNQMASAIAGLGTALSTAAGALTSASVALAVPITGPATAAPMLATAAGGLTAGASSLSTLGGLITTFESLADTFLSKKNTGD